MEWKIDVKIRQQIELRYSLEEMLDEYILRERGPFKSDIFSIAQVQNYMDKMSGPLTTKELQHVLNYIRQRSHPLLESRYRIPDYVPGCSTRRIRLRSIRHHAVWSKANSNAVVQEFSRYSGALKAPFEHAADQPALHTPTSTVKPKIGTTEYRAYISRKYKREQKRRADEPRVQAELKESKKKRAALKAKQRRSDEAEASQEAARYREEARG